MIGKWYLMVYRRLCLVDASDHAKGMRTRRFEFLSGTEADMRFYFDFFRDNPQVLAVELWCGGNVVDRFDRLMDTLPTVDPARLRSAVVEPRLLVELSAVPARPAG
jgi:hypothetical protein